MSWKFPRYDVLNEQVVDADDLNDNFFAFSEEIGGALNEHNFAAAGLTRNDLAADAGMRLYQSYVAVDGHDETASPANTFTEMRLDQWVVVDDANLSFTGAGAVWVMASFQMSVIIPTLPTGFRFALRVDGSVIPESLIGATDLDQDGNPVMIGDDSLTTTTATPLYPTANIVRGHMPVVCEALVFIAPGTHTIELVADGTTVLAARSKIFSRELIVVELRV